VKHILTVYRRQSCLGNTITAYLFLVTKEFFLSRETKKLTSLSNGILGASIRHDHMGLNAPKRCSSFAQFEQRCLILD